MWLAAAWWFAVPPLVALGIAAAVSRRQTALAVVPTCAGLALPYGETKLVGEWLVRAVGRAHGMGTISMCYFNVAGAAEPELADHGVFNLVPMVFERLDASLRPRLFGDDYPTPDSSCIRDYIHVADIADARVAAVRRLEQDTATELVLNTGRGEGTSVLEMLD